MPQDLVELFGDPLYAYFGTQNNGLANIGQEAILSHITINSSAEDFTPIDSDFVTTPMDPTIWERAALAPASVVQITDAEAFWLTWTMPDQGFKVQWSPAIEGEWVTPDPALPTPTVVGTTRRVLVPKEGLPMPNCFFRLIKP
jgi:hypothetical protein